MGVNRPTLPGNRSELHFASGDQTNFHLDRILAMHNSEIAFARWGSDQFSPGSHFGEAQGNGMVGATARLI
jgi:hypothetical protein